MPDFKLGTQTVMAAGRGVHLDLGQVKVVECRLDLVDLLVPLRLVLLWEDLVYGHAVAVARSQCAPAIRRLAESDLGFGSITARTRYRQHRPPSLAPSQPPASRPPPPRPTRSA